MGFEPVQRMKQRGSGLPERSHSLGTFRLQGFTPSCRFSPPEAAQVYFTPVALIGFSPSGAFPLKKLRQLVAVRRALVAFFPTAAGSHGGTDRGRSRPARLEFAAEPYVAFRASSFPRVRMHWRPRLRTPSTVPLLGFCLPVAFPSSEDETDFAASPLTRLNAPDFRVAPAVQNARAPAFSSPDAVALSLTRPPGHYEV